MISIIKKYKSLAGSNKILINCDIAELTLKIIKKYYPEDYRFEKILLDVRGNLAGGKSLKDITFNLWNINTSDDIHLERVVDVFLSIPFFNIDYIIESAVDAISQYESAEAWSQCGDRVNASYRTSHVKGQSAKEVKNKILNIVNSYNNI